MSLGRVAAPVVMVVALLFWSACGQVYRPVVIPCSSGGVPGCPVETNPAPANFHSVLGVSTNSPGYSGGAMQIDVSGDSIVGETTLSPASAPNTGQNPTHLAIAPGDSRVFVATAGSVFPGGTDSIASFSPVFQSTLSSGLGAVTSILLPTGSQPVFVNTTQTNAVYVANFGSGSVPSSIGEINTNLNVLANTAVLGASANPVSLAEMPNGMKIYSANQGNNTVSSLNTVDLSQNVVTGFSGVNPVWAVARGDSQKIYVVTEGDGQLVTIDTAGDTVTSSLPVGAGANFIFFDPNLNRLYVVNPVTAMVYVFSDTGGIANGVVSDVPLQLAVIPFAAKSPSCFSGCTPVSVTALLDGTRFYVASYQTAASCPDPVIGTGSACVIPGLTVFDANTFAVEYPTAPTLTLLTWPPFATNQYAVPPVTSCASPVFPALYTPSATRFRVFTVAAEDSSRVFVSMCDAGAIAVIDTTNSNANNSGTGQSADTLVVDLPAADAASGVQVNGQPLPQNPTFLIMGQ